MKLLFDNLAFVLLLFIICLAAGSSHSATLGRAWQLDQATGDAELVFEGEVTRIAFRDSEGPDETYLVAPHVFVTYRILQVLHGKTDARELTLRFTGGPSQTTGRIMMVPHAPLFKLGDRDILFVKGNGKSMCPLVGCGLGRFRIFQDGVYTDKGRAVRLNVNEQIQLSRGLLPETEILMEIPPLPEARLRALKRRIDQDPALTDSERKILQDRLQVMSRPRTIGVTRSRASANTVQPTEPPVSAAAFSSLIRRISGEYAEPDALVMSVSPDEPFRIERPAAAPTLRSGRPAEPRDLTLEQRLLRHNDGNPVLEDVR